MYYPAFPAAWSVSCGQLYGRHGRKNGPGDAVFIHLHHSRTDLFVSGPPGAHYGPALGTSRKRTTPFPGGLLPVYFDQFYRREKEDAELRLKSAHTLSATTAGPIHGADGQDTLTVIVPVAYLRPSNRHTKYGNLYFVGTSRYTGTGMPTADSEFDDKAEWPRLQNGSAI